MTESELPRPGRYEISELLGRGGMGAVYRGWDPELQRAVALKRLHPERASSVEAVERLRREARAVARLNHPAITRVYDLLEHDETVWLVLELVDGTSIDKRSAEKEGLSLHDQARWFREIAEGLAAAHDQGILHRDLKCENVMITRDGKVKILDFGLAKASSEGAGDESTLTRTGHLMGTFRAMSPEQILQEELDSRSDLFSLGVLIYEVLSGRSPFREKNPVITLQRVLSHRQRSLREVDPSIPRPLSDLVDRLLSKEPDGRPSSARAVLQELEGMAEEAWERPAGQPVEPHEAPGGESTLVATTERSPRVSIPDPSEETEVAPAEVEKSTGGTKTRFDPRLWVGIVLVALLALSWVAWPESRPEPAPDMLSAEYFDELLMLRARLLSVRGINELKALESDLGAFEERAPGIAEVPLLKARVLRRLFSTTRDRSYLDRAFRSVERARAIDPASDSPLIARLELALETGDTRKSKQLLDELDRRSPRSVRLDSLRAWWLRLEGRPVEAVGILRRAVLSRPSPALLYELALLEVSIADFDAARRHLEQILVAEPERRSVWALLAQAEMLGGRLDRAAELYERLLADHEDVASLSNLGTVELLRGNIEKALELCRKSADLAPGHAVSRLNLADALRLSGRAEEARSHYLAVVELTETASGSDHWQSWTVRAQALAQLGERQRALDALQHAWNLSDRREVSLEAAIVLAELGEDDRAREELRRAFGGEGGLAKVWLSLPALRGYREALESRYGQPSGQLGS